MLRNETHLRAAQREADNYPREVHADGRSWQFWSLSAVADSHRPVAWYTDGAMFRLFNVNGTPAESGGYPAAHDARCWDRWYPQNPQREDGRVAWRTYTQASIDYGFPAGERPGGSLRMADEKLPALREGYPAGRQHPLFPEVPDPLRLPPAEKKALLAAYQGRRVVAGTVGSEAWVTEVRELGESQLRARRAEAGA